MTGQVNSENLSHLEGLVGDIFFSLKVAFLAHLHLHCPPGNPIYFWIWLPISYLPWSITFYSCQSSMSFYYGVLLDNCHVVILRGFTCTYLDSQGVCRLLNVRDQIFWNISQQSTERSAQWRAKHLNMRDALSWSAN